MLTFSRLQVRILLGAKDFFLNKPGHWPGLGLTWARLAAAGSGLVWAANLAWPLARPGIAQTKKNNGSEPEPPVPVSEPDRLGPSSGTGLEPGQTGSGSGFRGPVPVRSRFEPNRGQIYLGYIMPERDIFRSYHLSSQYRKNFWSAAQWMHELKLHNQ